MSELEALHGPIGAPATPKARGGCLKKGLMVLGGLTALLVLLIAIAAWDTSSDKAVIKREALAQSEQVVKCLLTQDRECVRLRTADWPPETLTQTLKFAAWVDQKLGARLRSEPIEKSWSWYHSFGTGPEWRIKLQMRADYTNARGVVESVSLVGDEGQLRVHGVRFESNLLVPP